MTIKNTKNTSVKSKIKGIHFCHTTNQWYTRYNFQGKSYFCGRYDTLSQAKEAQKIFGKTIIKLLKDTTLSGVSLSELTPVTHLCNTSNLHMARLSYRGYMLFGGRHNTPQKAAQATESMLKAVKQFLAKN